MEPEDTKEMRNGLYETSSLEVSRERVESLWKQEMTHKNPGRSDLTAARASRAKAELERQRISSAALEATREACRELIGEAERQVTKARNAEADAKNYLTEAETHVAEAKKVRTDAESYREKTMAEAGQEAEKVRVETESYRQKVMAEADQEAQQMRDEARSAALQECEELKRHITYEVQCILSEVDSIRAAAQEELEAQRIYSEAASLRALAHDVRTQIVENVDRTMETDDGSEPTPPLMEESEELTSWEEMETVVGTDQLGTDQQGNAEPVQATVGRKSSRNGKGSSKTAS